jgi:hypothetical protein
VVAPVGGKDSLPEEERGLGVASLLINRLKRKEIARLRGKLRDLCVEEFVAIGREMVAPESRAIDDECEEKGRPADPNGALVDDVMRNRGKEIGHRKGVRETRNLKLETELWAEELQTTILL